MNDLPFHSCNQSDFLDLYTVPPAADQFTDLLSSHDFRKLVGKFTKDDQLQNLNCNYYTIDEFNTKFVKIKKNIDLSVFHVNIRSLNSKLREFCTLMKFLNIDFDVIVLSEIWSYNLSFYKTVLDSYYLFYDLPVSSSIGGVGLFVKKNLNPKIRSDLIFPTNTILKCECLFIEITKNKNKIIVGGFYRHPNQNIDLFTNILQKN